ncbi:hypothetical protein PR202_ga16424 [Eleusine coracana subsp. coracana]|uniref:Kinesin motor domain-containing protein n=1 Tax=Eleusine coracana subsp. coracana TaxID=191504 RepID=A0AAV5CN61_ELECO|nr:hypothetical protein PR202_ga16424 [Eleusine coracana subsp. coracana]
MAGEERIVVSVRLRPVNAREAERGDGTDWECTGPTTLMFRGTIPERAMFPAAYAYDRVFNPECSTRQVYEEGAKRVALSVLSGINSSVFAYGQTSSGKTYTMVGITEHSMSDIYDYIEKVRAEGVLFSSLQHPEREFILKFSAMEIYNEAVRDLLSSDATPLRLLDDPEKGTVVEKLTEETLRDKGHLLELLAVCEGSERASQTAAAGMRLKEGSHINRSLLTLGKVIRQLRNTLLFANCAKDGVTDAHVNVVMSDKALVKHLQRELARLENELKFPGSASCSNHAEALKEKDELIKQLEQQLKELMEQKDTVQSQLDSFRRVASEGYIDECAARRRDERWSSESLPHNASESALSSFDTYDAAYEDQDDFGSRTLYASQVCNGHHHNPELYAEAAKQECQQTMEEHTVSTLDATSNHGSESTDTYQANKEVPSEASEEPARKSNANQEKHGETTISTADNAIQLYTCDCDSSSDTEKPKTGESLALKRCVVSSRDGVLSRSRSCKASFMVIPNSWFDDSLDMNMTPPGEIFKYGPRKPEMVRRSLYAENGGHQNDLSMYCPVGSGRVASDGVADKSTCSFEEEGLTNDISRIIEHKLNGLSISPTEKNDEDVGADSSVTTVESPSRWSISFEKKQKEIIELWQECNVSIVHRTYFFLLFKGDKADNIYLEVEHRRLSFIKSSFSAGAEPNATVTSSLRNLRSERDMLYKHMLKKFHLPERESLYTKWGIDLNSKQRRLQLSRRIWTQTEMEHVRESAALVAKLVEHLERGQAIKEMFGLSFTLNTRDDRRSFNWAGA